MVAVFDELQQGVKQLEFLIDPAAGELRIGCTETMAAGFATAVLHRLSRQYPRVVFQLVPGDRDTLLSRELRQRTIELAVAPTMGLSPEGDTKIEILFDDQFVVMAGSPTKWIRRRKLVLADLLNELWVLPPPESLPGQYIAQAFRSSGFEPPRAHVVSFSIPLHYHLLGTGRYITMLPRSMLRFGKHTPLKLLPVKTPAGAYPIGILTLRDRTLSPLAQLFITSAREVAKQLEKLH